MMMMIIIIIIVIIYTLYICLINLALIDLEFLDAFHKANYRWLPPSNLGIVNKNLAYNISLFFFIFLGLMCGSNSVTLFLSSKHKDPYLSGYSMKD